MCIRDRRSDLIPAIEMALARHRELLDLAEDKESLEDQLESRKIVDRAKGKLMDSHAMSEQDAFRFLQQTAMGKRDSMRSVAESVLTGDLAP